jgi:hypothetical protein
MRKNFPTCTAIKGPNLPYPLIFLLLTGYPLFFYLVREFALGARTLHQDQTALKILRIEFLKLFQRLMF